jgi:hypothetical protein
LGFFTTEVTESTERKREDEFNLGIFGSDCFDHKEISVGFSVFSVNSVVSLNYFCVENTQRAWRRKFSPCSFWDEDLAGGVRRCGGG